MKRLALLAAVSVVKVNGSFDENEAKEAQKQRFEAMSSFTSREQLKAHAKSAPPGLSELA